MLRRRISQFQRMKQLQSRHLAATSSAAWPYSLHVAVSRNKSSFSSLLPRPDLSNDLCDRTVADGFASACPVARDFRIALSLTITVEIVDALPVAGTSDARHGSGSTMRDAPPAAVRPQAHSWRDRCRCVPTTSGPAPCAHWRCATRSGGSCQHQDGQDHRRGS